MKISKISITSTGTRDGLGKIQKTMYNQENEKTRNFEKNFSIWIVCMYV